MVNVPFIVNRLIVVPRNGTSAPMHESDKIASLSADRRIWAVGSIHGAAQRLRALHATVEDRVEPGDQIVYLGNFLGIGDAIHETVEEMLLFRRQYLARYGAITGDIVYLRGGQEEMWQKLLQIHLALNPTEVLAWMFNQGAAATLSAYGGEIEVGLTAVREGAMRLIGGLRQYATEFDLRMDIMRSWQVCAVPL